MADHPYWLRVAGDPEVNAARVEGGARLWAVLVSCVLYAHPEARQVSATRLGVGPVVVVRRVGKIEVTGPRGRFTREDWTLTPERLLGLIEEVA